MSPNFKLIFMSIGVFAGMPAIAAHAGGESSGGADLVLYSETMFRTKTPTTQGVNICFEKDVTFNSSDTEIKTALRWAYETWANYITERDVNYAIWTGSEGMSLKVNQVTAGCKQADDLHVFLGVAPASIETSLKRLRAPLAATDVFPGYEDVKWKKGFIWFAKEGSLDTKKKLPIWPTPIRFKTCEQCPMQTQYSTNEFRTVLLHEMGHVFGNNHLDSTIMSERIYQESLRKMEIYQDSYYGYNPHLDQPKEITIDQYIKLIENPGLSAKYKLKSAYNLIPTADGSSRMTNPNALNEAFEVLVGSKPVGKVSASVVREKSPNYRPARRADDQSSGNLVVTFLDGTKKYDVSILVYNKLANKSESPLLFNGQYGNKHNSFGFSFRGSVQPLIGKPVGVLVNYNMESGPLSVIKLNGGSTDQILLLSDFPNSEN